MTEDGSQPPAPRGTADIGSFAVESGATHTDLLADAVDGLLVFEAGAVAFANAAGADALGRQPDAVAGAALDDLFPADFVERVETVAETPEGERTSTDWTGTVRGPAGEERTLSARLQSPAESPRVVATVRADAAPPGTEGTRREETDPPATAVVDDVAVIGLDSDGRVSNWGADAERLLGRSRDEMLGTDLSVASPPDQVDEADPSAALSAAQADGEATTERWWARADGSEFWGTATITALGERPDDDRGFRLVLRDRTERKRIEAERSLLETICHRIADSPTFTDGVQTALEAICEQTEWAYGEAWTPTVDGESLKQAAAHAERDDLDAFVAASGNATFRAGEGLPGRVWESASPEWIPDAASEPPEVFHRTASAEAAGLGAALGVPIETDDGVVAILTFFLDDARGADDQLVEVVTDVAATLGRQMAHKRVEDALERERALLDRIFSTSPVALLVTESDGTVVRANERAGAVFGRPTDQLLGSDFDSFLGGFGDVGDVDREHRSPVREALAERQSVQGREFELARDDGETGWVSVNATPMNAADGADRVVVGVEDVTTRREREQSLRTFEEAVEHAGHSIYFTDTEGRIEYVNPTFEETTGYAAAEILGETPSVLSSGEHSREYFEELWDTITSGEVWTGEVYNERKSGERYVVNQTITPIVDDAGRIERYVAVNDEITAQKRKERTLRRQRNTLERIKQLLESLRPINRDLARAGTREEIYRAVCEQVASSEAYLFAWIGNYNAATGTVTPQEWAGIEPGFVRDLDLAAGDGTGADDVLAQAVARREVRAVRDLTTRSGSGERRERASEYGYQSMAMVPVVFGETVLGTIGVYSARADAFDSYERGLLRELGERIGHAINAAENKQLLHTDTVVELEFEVAGEDSVLAAVAAARDCRLSLKTVTPTAGSGYLCYLDVDDAAPSAVVDTFDEQSGVASARTVRGHGRSGVVEVVIETGPVATLIEHGATIRTARTTAAGGTLLAETRPDADIETLISDVEGGHDATVFMAKRTLDRSVSTMTTTKTAVEEALTPRQQEVLTLAYHAGYFKSPRDSTGEDLASVLGIASPTFYRHARKGIQRILGLLLEDLERSRQGD